MEKRILSVDFDYIMYPCIKLYNEYINTLENSTVMWNNLDKRYAINDHLSYDANALKSIQSIMLKNISKGAIFVPIKDHDEIVKNDIINNWISEGHKLMIMNIDYHHDLGYSDDTLESVMEFDEYDCSNWVSYLHLKGFLSDYYWIKAPTSDMPTIDVRDVLTFNINDIDVLEPNYDIVFFALSEPWIPYKYQHLYHLITNSCNEMYNLVKKGDKK